MALNFSSAAISNYECGVREPGLEELVLLAEVIIQFDVEKRK